MATINYTILRRRGPFTSTTNPDGSSVQTTTMTYEFEVSCSFHGSHVVSVLAPYTGASVQSAVSAACKAAYQAAPEVGISWSQTF